MRTGLPSPFIGEFSGVRHLYSRYQPVHLPRALLQRVQSCNDFPPLPHHRSQGFQPLVLRLLPLDLQRNCYSVQGAQA